MSFPSTSMYHRDPHAVNSGGSLGQSDETIPLGVFLVKSDCNEEKLLFRFPYTVKESTHSASSSAALGGDVSGGAASKPNKYALQMPSNGSLRSGGGGGGGGGEEIEEHGHLPTAGIDDHPHPQLQKSTQTTSAVSGAAAFLPSFAELISSSNLLTLDANDQDEISKVIGITDSTFSNLFGVLKSKLCGMKFELKVDNVRFVGHPSTLMPLVPPDDLEGQPPPPPNQAGLCFHVVFALKANAPADVVNCYHDLSKRIATALKSEETRCGYFSKETKIMSRCHDEIATALANAARDGTHPLTALNVHLCQLPNAPYSSILQRSHLAKSLQTIFRQLLNDGLVQVRINNLVNIHFCLPQKVHRKLLMAPIQHRKTTLKGSLTSSTSLAAAGKLPLITPASIHECLRRLRPYHTFLLLVNPVELVESLPLDVSSPVICLVKMASPLKNLIELSADAGISLSQTFNVVAQLVYWGKATVIFPICETNIYVLHPNAVTDLHSPLVSQFEARFRSSQQPPPNQHPMNPNASASASVTSDYDSTNAVAGSIISNSDAGSTIAFLNAPSRPRLHVILSAFSLGVSLSQLRNPMDSAEQAKEWVVIIEWMLQKRLLMQLHTYVVFFPLGHRGPTPFFQQHQQHQQRLSFTQQGQLQSSGFDRPPSSSTVDLNDCSTIATGSSYQSESSILGVSPSTRDSTLMIRRTHTTSTASAGAGGGEGSLEHLLNGKGDGEGIDLESSELILREALNLSPEEVKAVLAIPSAANTEDIRLFCRLCPYFDGLHHIEDMMHYENLRRSQILTLVDKFRDVLLVYQYEDTTVDTLQPYKTL